MTDQTEPTSEPANQHGPIRASFSMSRDSREAVRWVAERYGVDQGDVVDMAPALFAILAEASLNKRRARLAQLETAAQQAKRNIAGIDKLAPHLSIFAESLSQALNDLLTNERASIELNHVVDVVYAVIDPHDCGGETLLGRLTEVDDRPQRNDAISPLVDALRELAEAAGVNVDQDSEGEGGAPAYPHAMILRLGDGCSGNLAVAAQARWCRVTSASSMNESGLTSLMA